MFIRWKRKTLTPNYTWNPGMDEGYACPHVSVQRVAITPVLLHSIRDKKRSPTPVHATLWRPGASVRLCCLEDDLQSLLARSRFWVDHSLKWDMLQDRSSPYRKVREILLDNRAWSDNELARVVPSLTQEEFELVACWERVAQLRTLTDPNQDPRVWRWQQAKRFYQAWHDCGCPGSIYNFDDTTMVELDVRAPSMLQPFLTRLGLEWPCSPEDLKKVFREGVKVLHPDMRPNDTEANAEFIAFKAVCDQAMAAAERRYA